MSTRTTGAGGGLRTRISRVGIAAAALTLGLTALPGLAPFAHADLVEPADLRIQEIYGGGGNSGAAYQNDFVELVNTSDQDLDLDGWTLQYSSASGTFNGGQNTLALEGTVGAGEVFLIQLAAGNGNGEPLPEADLTGSINASGSQGVFALSDAEGTLQCTRATCAEDPAVIDLVGWGGAATFFGEAPAPRTDNATSVERVAATGENSTDFAAGAPTPGTLPDPEDPGDEDPGDGDDPGAGEEPVDPSAVSIAEIQGTGAESELQGESVVTEGVVTAVYATGGLNGYVIQTGGTGGALDFDTHEGSTALFVYSPATVDQVAIGDSVRVTGEVSEYYGSTQITVDEGDLEQMETELEPVEPATLASGFPTDEAQRESLEHMSYLPGEGDFTVTDVYPTNQFGEVGLAIGDQPLQQAGDIMEVGEEATAHHEAQADQLILLDDGRTTDFSQDPQEPMSWLTTEEPVRTGAAVTFHEPVIVRFDHGNWRLNTTTPWESAESDGIDFENTRQDTPDAVGGDLKVATFNVLNYFTSLGEDTPGCTPYTNIDGDGTTVRGGCDLRGAWGADDLERQQSKIVEAISGTGAAVVGLTEIENSARITGEHDAATSDLVAALNERDGEGTWDYIATGEAYAEQGLEGGQDAISNAIIYQPAQVQPVGDAQVLGAHEAFDNAREPIGQVFVPVRDQDAEQQEGEEFFVAVNHFKSKGSADDEDADLPEDPVQGNGRTSRLQQAEALSSWAEERAEELGVQDILLGGDFNAYTQEEPMQLFYDAGYTNLADTHDPEGWSYSFDGMIGSLDHIVANESGTERVTGATDWSINAPESVMTQYARYRNNVVDIYEEGVFGSSDHNPIIVGLDAGFPEDGGDPGEPGEPEDFTDVPPSTMFYEEIMWMAGEGYATGWDDGTFRPLQPVNRDAMAAFLYRMAGSPEVDHPRSEPFRDVERGDEHYDSIIWAYQQGITTGWSDRTFRPTQPITRDAMAAFVYRYAGSPDVETPSSAPFTDVSATSMYAEEIAWMKEEGITTGWPDDGSFRPLSATNRDATAAFLYRMSAEQQITYLSEAD